MKRLLLALVALCALGFAMESSASTQAVLKNVTVYLSDSTSEPVVVRNEQGKSLFTFEELFNGEFLHTFSVGDKSCGLIGGNCGGSICGDDLTCVVVCHDGKEFSKTAVFEAGDFQQASTDGRSVSLEFSLSMSFPPRTVRFDGNNLSVEDHIQIATEKDYKDFYNFYITECIPGNTGCGGKDNAFPYYQRSMLRFCQRGVSDQHFDDICHNACVSSSHISYSEFMKELKTGVARLTTHGGDATEGVENEIGEQGFVEEQERLEAQKISLDNFDMQQIFQGTVFGPVITSTYKGEKFIAIFTTQGIPLAVVPDAPQGALSADEKQVRSVLIFCAIGQKQARASGMFVKTKDNTHYFVKPGAQTYVQCIDF